MPLVSLLVCTPLACAGRPVEPAGCVVRQEQEREPRRVFELRGKVAWFQGSFEELLAEAARTKQIVFLDFFARTNTYSKKLERVTYTDPRVVTELAGLLCYSVDAEAKETKALRKRYQVLNAPALVFLDPDGALRDQLSGFYSPDSFLMELRRIRANTDTFSDLRLRIRRDPDDLDSRWALACKLRAIGDLVGHEEQLAELRERDPEGRSRASKRVRLAALHTAAAVTLELEPLYRFVEAESEPVLRFEGWQSIWMLEGQALRAAGDEAARRRHELRYFAAARELWPLVPREQHGFLGNNIAWSIYENRSGASRAELEFALGVARAAVAAAPDVPAVVDTLACCLFALGLREEALVQVKRCIELDPKNPEWRERLTEFQK